MKQALSFLLGVLLLYSFHLKSKEKKLCSLLENLDILKKMATHVEQWLMIHNFH